MKKWRTRSCKPIRAGLAWPISTSTSLRLGSCPRPCASASGIDHGLLDLSQSTSITSPTAPEQPTTWAVATFEVDGVVGNLRQTARDVAADPRANATMPPMRSAGLALLRPDRALDLAERARSGQDRADAAMSETVLTAEDLVLGYPTRQSPPFSTTEGPGTQARTSTMRSTTRPGPSTWCSWGWSGWPQGRSGRRRPSAGSAGPRSHTASRVAVAVLALPPGAVTALLGLLLMRSGFVSGLTAPDTSAQILAWALVSGYGRQLFTQLVDQQADSVLQAVRGGGHRARGPTRGVGRLR